MTPEQLKASILKYAMQGKLVEQKPEDGTGEDLFCKMQQVSKPNKNVTPIVEEEIPFDIPSSWKWCKFGELVDCSMGKTPPRAEPVWWQNDIHWVSISDMKDYGHISYTKEMVSQKALEEKFGGISTKGTLLMSFKLTVGRTSILDIDAVHNEAIISIYPYVDTENYFRDYLFYILPIVTQWGDSKNAIKGKTLNSKSIANLMIPLAPLNELQRIVAKIEELLPYEEQIKNNQKALSEKEAVIESLKADSERKLSEKDETIAAQANTIKDSSEENALLRDELNKYQLKEAEALRKKNRWRNILRFIWSIVWKLGVLVGITALAIYLESKCNSKIPMYISMGVNAVGVIYTLWSALKKDKEKYLKKDSGKSTSA